MSGKNETPEGFTEWEMVVTRDNSVFPPSHHEDLEVSPQDAQVPSEQHPNSPSSLSSLSSSSLVEEAEANEGEGHRGVLSSDSELPVGDDGIRRRFEIVRDGVFRLASRVRKYAVCGVGFWSFATVSGVVAAVLVSLIYRKVQRWRRRLQEETNNRLALVVREKEEKIAQLLLQVAHVNKLLSARRRVPVIRTG